MDETDVQHMCRTCLTCLGSQAYNLSDCCTAQKTYGQLLEEYGIYKVQTEQEQKFPQLLCAICARLLKKFHTFINKANMCKLQLVDLLAYNNQPDCLREETIDLPAKTDEENEINSEEDNDINDIEGIESIITAEHNEPNGLTTLSAIKEIETIDTNESDNGDFTNSDSDYKDEENSLSSSSPHTKDTPTMIYNANDKKPTPETCPVCMKNFKRKIYLLKHLRNVHHITKPGTFLKKQLGPKKNNACTKVINCKQCEYTANSYAALTYHKRTKHVTEEHKYKCKFCTFANVKRWALVGHIKNEHTLEFKTLKKSVEKEQPKIIATLNDLDTQPVCNEDISKEISLEDSSDDEGFIRRMINEERRIIKSKYTDGEPFNALARKCEECGKVYKNIQTLHVHKRFVHIPEEMYSVCLHCGKKYKRRQDLKNHILQNHTKQETTSAIIPDVQGKRFICTECPYATTTTTHLKIHIRRHHTGEKPFICEICGDSFITLYYLKKHSYLHTGEKPHKCPYCPKTFRVSAKLSKHKRTHTGERPYKCNECGKGFAQNYNLSVHKRVHNKQRNAKSLPVQ